MEQNQKRFFKILDSYFNKTDHLIILDVGARDCQESVNFSRYYENSAIYAFGCNPATIPICKRNIGGNARIELVEKAASDKNGETTFYPINTQKTQTPHKDGNPGASSLLKASGKYKKETYIQDEITVKTTTLETFLKEKNISAVDIVWVDVQGAEMLVLNSMGEKIKNVKTMHILNWSFLRCTAAKPCLATLEIT